MRLIVDLAIRAEDAEIKGPPGGGVVAVGMLGEVVVGVQEGGPDLFADFAGEGQEGERGGHGVVVGGCRLVNLDWRNDRRGALIASNTEIR